MEQMAGLIFIASPLSFARYKSGLWRALIEYNTKVMVNNSKTEIFLPTSMKLLGKAKFCD